MKMFTRFGHFALIDAQCFDPVMNTYAGIGPKGYRAALVIARIIKVKEQILPDRQLAKALKKNDLYRFVTNNVQPSHNTFNSLRQRFGIKGFSRIHKGFVRRAHDLGL
jgi:hypothetical protein